MAAGNNPTIMDPKVGINSDITMQSGDPPASFVEGDDKYTAPAGEAGVRILKAWVVNILTTAKLRVWYTESGGARDKIAQFPISPDFKPYDLDFLIGMVLNAGDVIEFASDTASALRIHVSVAEMKD